jgi:hypothetical protein
VVAERAQVVDDAENLRFGEDLAECRHPPIESPGRPAIVRDGKPVAIGLHRAKRAIGEIRDRQVREPDGALR